MSCEGKITFIRHMLLKLFYIEFNASPITLTSSFWEKTVDVKPWSTTVIRWGLICSYSY